MKNTKIIIKALCRKIKRLRKENKKLHDKHWEECRQIALYDEELKEAKRTATIRDFSRICRANKECEFCPMTIVKLALDCEYSTCAEVMADYPDEVNAAILKWCAEHPEQPENVSEQPEAPAEPEQPKKTYKQDFLEKFPDALTNSAGTPDVCRNKLYEHSKCNYRCLENYDGCRSCWNEVMPDERG